jgi:hypothetical protein
VQQTANRYYQRLSGDEKEEGCLPVPRYQERAVNKAKERSFGNRVCEESSASTIFKIQKIPYPRPKTTLMLVINIFKGMRKITFAS